MCQEEIAFDEYRRQPGKDTMRRVLEAYQDRIYNLCYQVLRHSEDAEDASQQVLLKFAEGVGSLPTTEEVRRWVYRVALNGALDVKRGIVRRNRRERHAAAPIPEASAPVVPEARDAVETALSTLDDDSRQLVVEHYFEKRSLGELAHREGCTAVAVWKKLVKAKEALERSLRRGGYASLVPLMDPYLGSLDPVPAPVRLLGDAVLSKAGVAGAGAGTILSTGGLTMAAQAYFSKATILVVSVVGMGLCLGGGVLIGSSRSGSQDRRAQELEHDLVAANRSLETARRDAAIWRAKAEARPSAGPDEIALLKTENDHLKHDLAARPAAAETPQKPSLEKALQDFAGLVSAKGFQAMADGDFAKLAKTFGEWGAEAAKKLGEMLLTGKTPEERGLSAYMLEALKSPEGLSALEQSLREDKDDMVRRFSSHALAMIRDPSSVPTLLEAMKSDSDFGVQINSAYGLAKGGNQEAIQWLMSYCESQDRKEYRLIVYPALADIADPSTAPLFRKLLEDPADISVLASAISALEKMKDQAALPALARLMQGNATESIKAAAQKAYVAISGQGPTK
jgi:RNA polymerase sigma-70 factor (ECF subfamily)